MIVRALANLVVALFLASALVQQSQATEEDALFMSAREAYQQGDVERLNRLSPSLESHVLWPYVAYWQFKVGPGDPTPSQWQQFLASQAESLITQRARGDLIRAAVKTQDWEAVEREFAAFELDDPEVRCLNLRARLARKDALALGDAKQMWAQPAVQGDSCTELFEDLIRGNQLNEADLWARVRPLLESNNVTAAKHIFKYFPPAKRPSKKVWDALAHNPTKFLQHKALSLTTRTERELAGFAMYRTALSLPELAHERWLQIKARYPKDEREYGWAQLAAAGAFKHRPAAQDWFKEAGSTALSERQLSWKVRSAIRASDWQGLAQTIDGMPEKDRQIATWRYWRARAYAREGKSAEANLMLSALSTEHNFYGQLAAEELGTAPTTLPEGLEVTHEDLQIVTQNMGLRRALKLFELDLRYEAVLEWRWNIRRLDDRQLLAAAEMARRVGWFDRTIDTAERTKQAHNFRLRFPLPYREVFSVYSERQGIDEAWVYGLVRQESRFAPQIRSSAGAMGLMQLMPATASQVARRAGLGPVGRADITVVDTNVSLGTYHLRELMDLLDNRPVLASAAYNAGLSRVRDWQPANAMDGAVFAETIPFSETRDYVKKVMSNTMYYARVLGQQFVPLKIRLGTVAGRLGGN